MTPKRLLVVAVLLVAGYSLVTPDEVPAPESTDEVCAKADALFDGGLYGRALAAYGALLDNDAPICAHEGAAAVGHARCDLAAELHSQGLDVAANEIYQQSILADPGVGCLSVSEPEDRGSAASSTASEPDVESQTEKFWVRAGQAVKSGYWSVHRWIDGQLSVFEAFVIGILMFTLIWHLYRLQQLRRTPIVEVGELENATGEEALDKTRSALGALLRSRLSVAGVRLPSLPGANAQDTAIAAVEASSLPQGKFLAALFKAVLSQLSPSVGHKVTGTLTKRDDGKRGLTLVLTDTYDGRSESVIATWEDDYETATEVAAARVYQHVIAELPRHHSIRSWMRWTGSGDSMLSYYRGVEEQDSGDLEAALEEFKAAVEADPANALPRFAQGNIFTEEGEHIEALDIYLKTVLFWPDLVLARYRLAATFSFAAEWAESWADRPDDERLACETLVRAADQLAGGPVDRGWDEASFLARAVSQFDAAIGQIESDIKKASHELLWLLRPLHRVLLGWRIWYPDLLAGIRHLKATKSMVEAARLCSRLQMADADFAVLQKDLNGLFKRWIVIPRWTANWQTHYNAACFYSIATAKAKLQADQGIDQTLSSLAQAMDDPQSQVTPQWLCEDPDLEALRRDPRGSFLADHCHEDQPSSARGRRVLTRLRLAWVLLTKSAERRRSEWSNAKGDSLTWTDVQGRDLEKWCQREHEIWSRLAHWSSRPEDVTRQEEFWRLLLADEADDKAKKLPTLALPDQGSASLSQAGHRRLWRTLQGRATELSERWDWIEDKVREGNRAGTTPISLARTTALAERTQEYWSALKDWAEDPSDDGARAFFLDKSGPAALP